MRLWETTLLLLWPKKSLRDWRFRRGKFTGPSSSDRDGQIKLSRGGREKRVAKATPLNAWIWARISVQPLSVVEFGLTRAEMGWSDLLFNGLGIAPEKLRVDTRNFLRSLS